MTKEKIPPKPDKCYLCGSTDFWLRSSKREWVCNSCHPRPKPNNVVGAASDG